MAMDINQEISRLPYGHYEVNHPRYDMFIKHPQYLQLKTYVSADLLTYLDKPNWKKTLSPLIQEYGFSRVDIDSLEKPRFVTVMVEIDPADIPPEDTVLDLINHLESFTSIKNFFESALQSVGVDSNGNVITEYSRFHS